MQACIEKANYVSKSNQMWKDVKIWNMQKKKKNINHTWEKHPLDKSNILPPAQAVTLVIHDLPKCVFLKMSKVTKWDGYL